MLLQELALRESLRPGCNDCEETAYRCYAKRDCLFSTVPQTVDKLDAGCYAQHHFSLNIYFILVLSSKYKKFKKVAVFWSSIFTHRILHIPAHTAHMLIHGFELRVGRNQLNNPLWFVHTQEHRPRVQFVLIFAIPLFFFLILLSCFYRTLPVFLMHLSFLYQTLPVFLMF